MMMVLKVTAVMLIVMVVAMVELVGMKVVLTVVLLTDSNLFPPSSYSFLITLLHPRSD